MRIERISRLRDEFIEALRQGRHVEVSDFLAEDLAEDERDELREQLEECVAIHARLADERPPFERVWGSVADAIGAEQTQDAAAAGRGDRAERRQPRSTFGARGFGVVAVGYAAVAALIAGAVFWAVTLSRPAWSVNIAGGAASGTLYPFAETMGRAVGASADERLRGTRVVPTSGSAASLASLVADPPDTTADVALVLSADLAPLDAATLRDLTVIARLRRDLLHVVVRDAADVTAPTEIDGKRVYLGAPGSAGRRVAEVALAAWGVTAGPGPDILDDDAAGAMLVSGDIDAAFYLAPPPADAVARALASGECSLLDLGERAPTLTLELTAGGHPGLLSEAEIPAGSYDSLTVGVATAAADVLLMARVGLSDDLVVAVLDSLFDNVNELASVRGGAEGFGLDTAFDFGSLPASVAAHGGVAKFQEQEAETLHIAAGYVKGKYAQIARVLQASLREWDVPARVVYTDGSIANMAMLTARPALAIAQYDVALAARAPALNPSYAGRLRAAGVEAAHDMRSIAVLHDETVHVFARRDRVSEDGSVLDLEGLDVSVGPDGSGTQALAEAVLEQHGIRARTHALGIDETIRRVFARELDAGFFVGAVPTPAVRTLLDYDGVRLLSMEPMARVALLDEFGLGLLPSRIEAGVYACQGAGEGAIDTLTTRAVLVTTADLPFDVEKITEAVFASATHLGVTGGAATMARPLPSIPLHDGARAHLRAAGLLPQARRFSTGAEVLAYLVTICVVVLFVPGVWLRYRDRTAARRLATRIRAVTFGGDVDDVLRGMDALEELRRDAAGAGVLQNLWRSVSEARAEDLDASIDRRIAQGSQALARGLSAEIRSAFDAPGLDAAGRRATYDMLGGSILRHVADGHLSLRHQALAQSVLADAYRGRPDAG